MTASLGRIFLKPGRDRTARQGHPWIFSGAIARLEPDSPGAGPVEIRSADGAWLGRGLYCPNAALAVRMYTWREDEPLDPSLFARRLSAALAWRKQLFPAAITDTTACRLAHAEADGLSGLIVDRYADVLSVRVSAAGLLPFLPALLRQLRAAQPVRAVVVEAEPDAVEREGLDPAAVAALGDPPPGPVAFRENGLDFTADVTAGQKTGFFLDQRDNRARVARWAAGRRVLSAYCYTGAFEAACARAGATDILGLDTSAPALERAAEHARRNAPAARVVHERADVPQALRRFRDAARTFDLIILDPPRFVFSAAQLDRGLRAYKDINLLALKLLTPGGLLATFSCSGLVTPASFREMFRWAAADSGRRVRIVETFSQPPDHPISPHIPESEYLKGLLAVVE